MGKSKPPITHPNIEAETTPLEGEMGTQTDALRKMSETLAAPSAQFTKVLQAVLDTKTSLERKIDSVVLEVNLLRTDQRKLSERVATTETTLETAQSAIIEMKAQIQCMENNIASLQRRAEDDESRSRRNNVRFMGVPEQLVLLNAEHYLEQRLKDTVLPQTIAQTLVIERAHSPRWTAPDGRSAPPADSKVLKL
ncbi:hypothetical protein NDU88_013200 [Pleurodeles waltl]|uniref:Uncharacterized protein n=1 Tax=Pleurodeles waltl TaxID=8319 RepID=A0AAV7R3S3_PLEWA|nr:hypothetical protein NDU88_013200 [Pleurodeles waltl]